LRHCNFFKVSDEEAMLITNTASLEDATAILLKETTGVFTITLGKDGTLLGLNGQQYIIESIPIKPVDTTGAGDAFVGAVLYQLSHLEPSAIQSLSLDDWNKIILNANKAGARTCEYMGAMEAFKFLNNQIFK
jgi:fructokinase